MIRYYLSLLLVMLFSYSWAQMPEDLSVKKLGSLQKVELFTKEKTSFPESYLIGMKGDSLVLLTDVSAWNEPPRFAQTTVNIGRYDYMTLTSRSEKIKKSLIWGTVLGAISFHLAREMTRTQPQDLKVNKAIIGQQGHDGIITGIIGGVTGFGLGVSIGLHTAKRKIDLRGKQSKTQKTLKQINF